MTALLRQGDEEALGEVLYWLDFPLGEFLPELAEDFRSSAPLDFFPGGAHSPRAAPA